MSTVYRISCESGDHYVELTLEDNLNIGAFPDKWSVNDVEEWGVAAGTWSGFAAGEPSLYSNEPRPAALIATLHDFTKDTKPPKKGTGSKPEIEQGNFPSGEFTWECLKKT
jgi:hypothetical protein